VSLFIPVVTTVIPVFVVTNQFGLINTYPGLIIPIAAQTGFGTLLFRQYIVTMPQELFDAARMDGAGWWLLLRRLVVPLAKPATAAYLAISVITAWNMYLWPLLAANAPHVETLSEIVAAIGQGDNFGYNVSVPAQFAATVITVVPMVIAFLLVQPAFVRGLTGSGVE